MNNKIKMDVYSLTFCISCMNNLSQLKQTLRQNLDDNAVHREYIDFVVVDFNSDDGLDNWLMDNFYSELQSGYLKYYFTRELLSWHEAIAYNTTCYCASHDIVVNLGCSAFTGFFGGVNVIREFTEYPDMVRYFQFVQGRECRIHLSVRRKYVDRLGGYDESFEPFGYHCMDFINRCRQFGLPFVSHNPINTKDPGLDKDHAIRISQNDYYTMMETNRLKSDCNLSEGYIIANNGVYGIRKNIVNHKGTLVY